MVESRFQRQLVDRLKREFPGCYVTKMNSLNNQGIPDLLILYGPCWALLEVKRSATAPHRPNQDWWVDKFNNEGFADFVFPENVDNVMLRLHRYFDDVDYLIKC